MPPDPISTPGDKTTTQPALLIPEDELAPLTAEFRNLAIGEVWLVNLFPTADGIQMSSLVYFLFICSLTDAMFTLNIAHFVLRTSFEFIIKNVYVFAS